MRTILKKLTDRLHAVEDHLTVRMQIAAAVAAMCAVLVARWPAARPLSATKTPQRR